MPKVVVLGGGGFVGRAVVRSLSGLPVAAPASRDVDLRRPGALEAVGLDRDTTVVMAAAITRNRADDAAAYEANLAMIRGVAEAVARRPVAKLVFLSSSAVYGNRGTDLAVTEDTPPDPESGYGRAKLEGEAIARSAGSPSLALRLVHVYGPGDPHPTYGPAGFIEGIRREGAATLYGDGEDRRDHLHVDDAGALIARLALGTSTGVLNLASGRAVSFREIAEGLRAVVPAPFEIRSRPRKRPLTHQVFDIRRLAAAAPGFVPTPLADGLRSCWI